MHGTIHLEVSFSNMPCRSSPTKRLAKCLVCRFFGALFSFLAFVDLCRTPLGSEKTTACQITWNDILQVSMQEWILEETEGSKSHHTCQAFHTCFLEWFSNRYGQVCKHWEVKKPKDWEVSCSRLSRSTLSARPPIRLNMPFRGALPWPQGSVHWIINGVNIIKYQKS